MSDDNRCWVSVKALDEAKEALEKAIEIMKRAANNFHVKFEAIDWLKLYADEEWPPAIEEQRDYGNKDV